MNKYIVLKVGEYEQTFLDIPVFAQMALRLQQQMEYQENCPAQLIYTYANDRGPA